MAYVVFYLLKSRGSNWAFRGDRDALCEIDQVVMNLCKDHGEDLNVVRIMEEVKCGRPRYTPEQVTPARLDWVDM